MPCRRTLLVLFLIAPWSVALLPNAAAVAAVSKNVPRNASSALPGRVTGSVLRGDGVPLPGASVALVLMPNNFSVMEALAARQPAAEPVASARSDEHGRFVLVPPRNGVFRVIVRAESHLTMWYFLLPVTHPVELPPVTLLPAVKTEVMVRDPEGRPRAGVVVYGESADPGRWRQVAPGGWRPWLRLGWSGDDGKLSLDRARGESLDLRLYALQVAQLQRQPAASRHEVVVEPPRRGPRSLLLREADGTPIAGAMVAFGDLALPIGRTDGAGRLDLAGTDDEPVELLLLTADGRYRNVTYQAPAADSAPATELRFPVSMRLTGRVVEEGGGEPVANAVVWPTHDPGLFVRTAADGRFDILAAASKTYRLQAHAAGRAPFLARFTARQLAAHGGVEMPVALAIDLTGLVVDEAGDPVDGVHLVALRADAAKQSIFRLDTVAGRATSDREGGFRMASLAAGHGYRLSASKRGYTLLDTVGFRAEAAEGTPLRVVLHRGRRAQGRVVDQDDRPVVGAAIRLRTTGDGAPAGEAGDAVGARGNGGEDAGAEVDPFAGVTGEHGRFEIRMLPPGRLDITAAADGFAPMTVRGVQVPAGDRAVDLGTLVLAPGVTIEGMVRDPQGQPVAGAAVWALIEDAPSAWLLEAHWSRAKPDANTVSDAHGRFTVVDLEPGRALHLRVDGEGYLPTILMGVEPGAGMDRDGVHEADQDDAAETVLVVVLTAAALLSGRVTNEAGMAVAGAEVNLEPGTSGEATAGALGAGVAEGAPAEGASVVDRSRTVHTDEDGKFVIADVAPGRHAVAAFADGYQPAAAVTLTLRVDAPRDDLHFVLRRGAVLAGTILDREGLPIEGAQVLVGQPNGRSDTDGAFRVTGLAVGRQQVEVRHPGYNGRLEEVEIVAGENQLDLVLEGGNRIAGRVIDEYDLPVAGAVVELRPGASARAADSPGQHHAASGEDGRFALPQVPDGQYYVVAEKGGYVSDRLAVPLQVVGAAAEDLEVLLRQGATLRGRILGLDFQELAQVTVRAQADERTTRFGTVDFEGGYEVADLATGDWLVTAHLRGGSREARARVTLASGETEAERDLEFGGGVTLTGLVLYGGEPLADTRVQVRGRDVPIARAVATGFDGRFEVADLQPGTYHLGLSHAGERLIHNQDLEVSGDRDVVIEIDTAHLSGTVTSAATGEPLESAVVRLLQAVDGGGNGSLFVVGSDALGFFEVPKLSAGKYHLSVQLDGYEPGEQALEVAAGADVGGLSIALKPTDGFRLLVRLASGQRPHMVTVKALDPTGRPVMVQTRVIAADGFARFASVPPGTWDLLIGARGGALGRKRATIPGEPIEVVLLDAGRLKVRVPALVESEVIGQITLLASDGTAFLRMDVNGEVEQQWPLAAGRATIEDLPAGQWTVRASAPDGRTWTRAVATTGGPDIALSLE